MGKFTMFCENGLPPPLSVKTSFQFETLPFFIYKVYCRFVNQIQALSQSPRRAINPIVMHTIAITAIALISVNAYIGGKWSFFARLNIKIRQAPAINITTTPTAACTSIRPP